MRVLVLVYSEEWRRCDHGFWLLWSGAVAVAEGASDSGVCDDAQVEGGAEQQGRRRCDHRARLSGRHGDYRGFLELAVYQGPGGGVLAAGDLAGTPHQLSAPRTGRARAEY